jgi:hypothetical protein
MMLKPFERGERCTGEYGNIETTVVATYGGASIIYVPRLVVKID